MPETALSAAIATYGRSLKAKLGSLVIDGAPEDQLRSPLERLFADLTEALGRPKDSVTLVGETSLSDLRIRPDFAVAEHKALIGFIEVKRPGKGADPRKFTEDHDKAQWLRLRSLPNLLYTDGQSFALWRDGELFGKVVPLDGDIATAGATLTAPDALLDLFRDFLTWSPIPPTTPRRLAEVSARLCRLLRDEVIEELGNGAPALTDLAKEWRGLLFPEADDAQFADGYAQAVTFGLLMARAKDIPLSTGIDAAAKALRQTNSIIGTALRLLTDAPETTKALDTALKTLTRVLDAVHWPTLTKGNPEAWLYFYEDFLAVYDRDLRKLTGSYYTPPEVVAAMVRLTDEALRDPALFGRPRGLASPDVTIADPATGTGTFLLGVLRSIAATIAADQGEGAVGPALVAAANRLIGFEMQFGPFAVAQLRLLAEMQALIGTEGGGHNLPIPQLYVTDTLGNPYLTETTFSSMVAPIGDSRRRANEIKKDTPITVVIGNPPYKDKAAGKGGWIEKGGTGAKAPMDLWALPPAWGLGAHAKHLKNLYVYFWRWATWKVFAPDLSETTGRPDEDRGGIVCFITVSGFLNGPGFQKMRAELRRDASDIWVIDCSPEGHQPAVSSRIFQGVQHPVCIVLAARRPGKSRNTLAQVRVIQLPAGRREAKFEALSDICLSDGDWELAAPEWRAPFLPQSVGEWANFANLSDLFQSSSSGVMPCRTWVISPDARSLEKRWETFVTQKDPQKKSALLYPSRDRTINTVVESGLGANTPRLVPLRAENGPMVPPVRYGYRTFDRQWLIPDHRLITWARPALWAQYSESQVYLTALDAHSPDEGPSLSFTNLLPDQHHFKGSFGGRAFPLWRDARATIPNLAPGLLAALSATYGHPVPPEDALAWIAALLAHPAYTARFQHDLRQPGLRVPLTADPALFARGVALGREVIWLHCYGERFADPVQGRPAAPPRMAPGTGPTIPKGGTIPGAPEPLPDTMSYDAANRRLHVGKGHVDNVAPAVWAYEVSGKNVLRQWFSYRRRDRTRPVIGDRRPPSPLDRIQPDHWLPEYTEDLLNLLHVLGRLVALEPAQAALLDEVCAGPLIDAATLAATPAQPLNQSGGAAISDLFNDL